MTFRVGVNFRPEVTLQIGDVYVSMGRVYDSPHRQYLVVARWGQWGDRREWKLRGGPFWWWHNRVVQPLRAALRKARTAEQLAYSARVRREFEELDFGA